MSTNGDHGRNNAVCALQNLREMVAAVQVDYDRLEELRDEREALEGEADALAAWDAENGEELRELADAAGDCEDHDDALTRIHEDPLSLDVRSGWYAPGTDRYEVPPEEFCFLLTTGGPALRMIGELNEHGEPTSARLEYQDWGTPWTVLQTSSDDEAILLEYARQFCFEP